MCIVTTHHTPPFAIDTPQWQVYLPYHAHAHVCMLSEPAGGAAGTVYIARWAGGVASEVGKGSVLGKLRRTHHELTKGHIENE